MHYRAPAPLLEAYKIHYMQSPLGMQYSGEDDWAIPQMPAHHHTAGTQGLLWTSIEGTTA